MKERLKLYWSIIRETFAEFQEDDPMSFSAAIGFYTIFSLPAILLVVIRIAGIIFGEEAVEGELYLQIKDLVGAESAMNIQKIIQNASLSESGWIATVVGIATLVFSATTVFMSIQSALNKIWGVKAKPKRGIVKFFVNRLISFAMVVSLGFLMAVSLLLDAAILVFKKYIQLLFPDLTVFLLKGFQILMALVVLMLTFGVIFKMLPDVRIRWRDAWIGAFATAVLFSIGKFLIGLYLNNSDIGSTYGAAGSFVVVLVWVYYSSVILLLGAEFTQVYSRLIGKRIAPAKDAVRIKISEIEE